MPLRPPDEPLPPEPVAPSPRPCAGVAGPPAAVLADAEPSFFAIDFAAFFVAGFLVEEPLRFAPARALVFLDDAPAPAAAIFFADVFFLAATFEVFFAGDFFFDTFFEALAAVFFPAAAFLATVFPALAFFAPVFFAAVFLAEDFFAEAFFVVVFFLVTFRVTAFFVTVFRDALVFLEAPVDPPLLVVFFRDVDFFATQTPQTGRPTVQMPNKPPYIARKKSAEPIPGRSLCQSGTIREGRQNTPVREASALLPVHRYA